jgi:ubiquinone/menaquinone biosynthesis C-methylase UbiE
MSASFALIKMPWDAAKVKEYYANFADKYDSSSDSSSYPSPEILSKWMLEYFTTIENSSASLLDVGCGTGQRF